MSCDVSAFSTEIAAVTCFSTAKRASALEHSIVQALNSSSLDSKRLRPEVEGGGGGCRTASRISCVSSLVEVLGGCESTVLPEVRTTR